MFNPTLRAALAIQLNTEHEISFMYNGQTAYIQGQCEDSDFQFDIGFREDEQTTDHEDGGLFDGIAEDCITSVLEMMDEIKAKCDKMNYG